MSSYLGRHAQLYDLFYADKPYAKEAAFVADLLSDAGIKPGAQLLDVACGTGRHALEFCKLGFHVTGVDYSADQLKEAESKHKLAGTSARFLCQDMRGLKVEHGPLDAVSCLFDSIGYVVHNADVLKALWSIHDQLRPSGAFVCEFWHAAGMLRGFDPVRVRRFKTPEGGTITRISETTVDAVTSTATVTYTIYEQVTAGKIATFTESQRNRFFLRNEFALLLETAGLKPLAWYGGYDRAAPVDVNAFHLIVLAQRSP